MAPHYPLEFSLNQWNLTVQLDPFTGILTWINDQQIVWHLQTIEFRLKNGIWKQIDGAALLNTAEKSFTMKLSAGTSEVFQLKVSFQQNCIDLDFQTRLNGVEWTGIVLAAQANEHFVGFGQRFDRIDQRGKQVVLWVEDGATLDMTYMPVPFYMSSQGYGLWLDTTKKVIARIAMADDPTHVSLRIDEPGIHLKVFLGENFKKILTDYTQIAGRPALPPEWVFGPWKSRDWQTADQHGILEDIDQQAALGLPATVKLIDARWEVAYHSFRFDPRKFPDPQVMIARIHTQGNRVILWITPWMAVNNFTDPNDYYEACAERGFFLKRPDGEIYVSQMGLNPMLVGSCIDFTNPAAVEWYQEQLRALLDLGVDGFQTDFGEQVPEDAVFYDGRSGREMHNLYPRLYNEITFEVIQAAKAGVMLTRSGWHGSQKHSVIWSGDQSSDFALNNGMHSALIAGQTAGLSGFPFWSSDIGGYFGDPTEEVYKRWTQFGAFSPIMMLHGAGKREPWGFSESALQNYHHFSRLHTDLFPYIYTYARIASATGIPIMRAMALEFEGNPAVWQQLCEDQYAFGSELIIAPVHYSFSRLRPVYLPPGLWRNFWTGEQHPGGQEVLCRAELDEIPVFAKAGAIIPRLDPTPLTLVPDGEVKTPGWQVHLRVDIYPGADGRFELYDGTLLEWHETDQQLRVSRSPVERQVSVRLVNAESGQRFSASSGGEEIPVRPQSLAGEGSYSRASVSSELVIFQVISEN